MTKSTPSTIYPKSPSALEPTYYMQLPPHEMYRKLFLDSVPRAFLLETLRCIVRAFDLADKDCSGFRRTVRRDSFGNRRRAWVEQLWYDIAPMFPGVQFTEHMNRTKTASHVRASAGRVVLTESAVNERHEFPRDADFRATYARSPQRTLFDIMGMSEPPPPQDAMLFAMLTYGPSTATRPYFASVVIPDRDCREVIARIPLDDELALILAEHRSAVATEVVADDLVLTVKQGVSETSGNDSVASAATSGTSGHLDGADDDLDTAQPSPEEHAADNPQLRLIFPDTTKKQSGDWNGS